MPTASHVRNFAPDDAGAVAELFGAYMRETYGAANAMTAEIILRDGQGHHFNLVLAVDHSDRPIGFAAWRGAYDLHHAVWGAEIPDLFIAGPYRGRALALRLVGEVARIVAAAGGKYVRGEVIPDDHRLRLVRRLAAGFLGETVFLSGSAFHTLAAVADAAPRELASRIRSLNLPPTPPPRR
jgi:GNAT superfamily N-acetyltransferase